MANANSTIEIELEIKQALDRLNRLERELQKSAQQMQKAADATGKLEGALNKAKTAAAGLFAFFSGQQIVEAADQFTNFANAVRISTNSVAEQTAVQKELYRVAQTTGSSLGDISKLYGRLRQAADQLGSSQAETIKITEIVGKALAASGTSASEASGALLQLAQALNSPRVQAEEFNSLVDAMPNLLRQVERQLGITAGGLKKFVTDGQLSNKLFRDAILGSAAAIDDQFGKANDTIATALTRLNNAFILLVGNFEESTGFFNKTAAVISGLAENMDELVRVLKAVAVGFAIAFAPKVIRAIRDTATAMATLGAASKTNVIGALAALGFYIADITGGLDLLTEKLGLTKEETEKTADAIVDLTKVSGGGVAAIAPVVPVPSQSYLQALDFMRSVISDTSMTSEQIMASLKDYSEAASAAIFDVQTKVVSGFDDIDGATIKTGQGIEEIRHIIQLFGLAYEQALGREAGESANVLALQFLAAQQAMKVLLDLRDQELAVIAEVEARIAEINERGIERTESERIILRYQNEIAEVMADETFSLLQRERIVKALEAARDRELENAKEVLTYQEMITDELQTQLGLSERAASAAVSGVFGAGPSAGRAGSIAQSQSLDEALMKLVFSNEEIAKSIDDVFAELFQLLDPILDKLADLVRLMGRLIDVIDHLVSSVENIPGVKQASEAAETAFKNMEKWFQDRIDLFKDVSGIFNVPQNTVVGQALNFVGLGGGGGGGGDQGPSQEEINAYLEARLASTVKANEMILEIQQSALDVSKIEQVRLDYQEKIKKVSEDETLVMYDQNRVISELIATRDKEIEKVKQESFWLAYQQIEEIRRRGVEFTKEEEINYRYKKEMVAVRENENLVIKDQDRLIEELAEARNREVENIAKVSKALTDAAISDIERRGLAFTEQQEIEYRYAKEIAAAQENTNLTTADQIRLVNALEAARQREIDALEREADLLRLTNLQQALISLFDDFEEGLVQIREVVDGLVQQVQDLLFSEFNLDPVRDKLSLASESYQDLLAKALDPDATEEDIQAFQQFVNTYLTSARDVFKSSTAYRDIFDQVLTDLQSLGLAYGENAPINLIEDIQEQLRSLEVEFGENLQVLIDELDRLATAFRSQSLEFDGSVNVDLGRINASFDSTPFLNAINQLNIDIASAINALIATIGDASDAITDTGDGGTVTPTPITEMIGPYGAGSQYSSVSGFDPLQTTLLTAASGGKLQLMKSLSDLSGTDVNQLIQTMVEAQLTEYGTAADVIAKQSYAVVYGVENGQQRTIVYGAEAKSDLESFISGLTGSGFEYLGGYNFQLPSTQPAPAPAPTPTPTPTPAPTPAQSIMYNYAASSPATGAAISRTTGVIAATIPSHAYEYSNLIRSIIQDYENLYGSPLTQSYGYGLGFQDSLGNRRSFVLYNTLQAAVTREMALQQQGWSVTRFGFRYGGLVPDPMDTIPAMLSPGEYILSPETVRRFGVSSLNQLNSGDASAISQTNDPEVKRLLAELIQAVRESDTEVNVYTDMRGQAKAAVEEFRSEIKERSRRQGDQFIPVRYI